MCMQQSICMHGWGGRTEEGYVPKCTTAYSQGKKLAKLIKSSYLN